MTAKKLARQKRALERFTILTHDEWLTVPEHRMRETLRPDAYKEYLQRKTVERQALIRRTS